MTVLIGSSSSIAVVREVINVLDYAVDPTGVTDSTAGLQAAYNAAKTNVGGRTQGEVFHRKGRYKHLAELDAEGIITSGEGNEASQLYCPNDLGTGKFQITFQKTQTATKKYCGPRDLQIQGPNLNSGLGAFPANMDGVRLGNAGLMRGCDVRGHRAALNLFKDHENIEHSTLTGGFGVLFDKTQSGGDQLFTEVTFSGCLVASVAVHPDSNVGGANFFKCHLGFCPVPLLKLDVQGTGAGHLGHVTPGMYDVTFTGTIGGDGVSVTGITGVTTGPGWGASGVIANAMRVVSSAVPAGATISNYNSGAGTLTLSAASTPGAGVTFYAGVMQPDGLSAVQFNGSSFESYGNALIYYQPVGMGSERRSFRDCFCSNAMDSNTRVPGWPADACINGTSIGGDIFDNSEACLAVGAVSVFKTGTGGSNLRADLGELSTTIDAVNTAGKKLLSYASAPNLSGTRFVYSSGSQGGAIDGDLVTLGGTAAVGDLLSLSGTQAVRHNGTSPTAGVAMQAGASADRVPRALSGSISVNVHASNSGLFAAANKWVKPDATNAGYVVEASGPTDGDVIGKTLAVQSGGKVLTRLIGLR